MFDPDCRHTLALPYWARPGIALFAKRADDNDGGDEDENDDEDDDDEDDEDPDAELSDEELRAELKATRERLAKASNQSAKRRKQLRERSDELEAERSKRGGKPKGKDGEDAEEIDVEAIRSAATAEGRKAALGTVKRVAIRAALKGAGISDDKTLKRAIGMIDADELDVDDDGEVDGLDDAIATLKDEVPAIFGTTRRRRSVGGQDDRNGDKDPKPKDDDASKRQARSLLGKG